MEVESLKNILFLLIFLILYYQFVQIKVIINVFSVFNHCWCNFCTPNTFIIWLFRDQSLEISTFFNRLCHHWPKLRVSSLSLASDEHKTWKLYYNNNNNMPYYNFGKSDYSESPINCRRWFPYRKFDSIYKKYVQHLYFQINLLKSRFKYQLITYHK